MRNKLLINSFALLFVGSTASVAIAQQPDDPQAVISNLVGLNRAKNYARQAAEKANGGLSNYRAESAMHGSAADAPHVTNPDGSRTFTFMGTLFGPTPALDGTVQSVVTVTPAGDVRVDYNGPVRQ